MENERISNEKNETSINIVSYEKEYSLLDQASGAIDFNVFEDPLYNEQTFYTTLARYIELMKTENKDNRIIKVQEFINKIKNFPGSEEEKIKNYDKLISEALIKWYSNRGHNFGDTLQIRLTNYIDHLYKKREGKLDVLLPGIDTATIPERFYGWFTKSGLEERVMNKNREGFVESMRYQREKADELAKKL